MKAYTVFNLVLAGVILPTSYWLAGRTSKWHILLVVARISSLMTLLAYPWDYWAIQQRVWRYPLDPGLQVYEVPMNDLIFIWLCTCLACSVLGAIGRWESTRDGNSKRDSAREQHASHY